MGQTAQEASRMTHAIPTRSLSRTWEEVGDLSLLLHRAVFLVRVNAAALRLRRENEVREVNREISNEENLLTTGPETLGLARGRVGQMP